MPAAVPRQDHWRNDRARFEQSPARKAKLATRRELHQAARRMSVMGIETEDMLHLLPDGARCFCWTVFCCGPCLQEKKNKVGKAPAAAKKPNAKGGAKEAAPEDLMGEKVRENVRRARVAEKKLNDAMDAFVLKVEEERQQKENWGVVRSVVSSGSMVERDASAERELLTKAIEQMELSALDATKEERLESCVYQDLAAKCKRCAELCTILKDYEATCDFLRHRVHACEADALDRRPPPQEQPSVAARVSACLCGVRVADCLWGMPEVVRAPPLGRIEGNGRQRRILHQVDEIVASALFDLGSMELRYVEFVSEEYAAGQRRRDRSIHQETDAGVVASRTFQKAIDIIKLPLRFEGEYVPVLDATEEMEETEAEREEREAREEQELFEERVTLKLLLVDSYLGLSVALGSERRPILAADAIQTVVDSTTALLRDISMRQKERKQERARRERRKKQEKIAGDELEVTELDPQPGTEAESEQVRSAKTAKEEAQQREDDMLDVEAKWEVRIVTAQIEARLANAKLLIQQRDISSASGDVLNERVERVRTELNEATRMADRLRREGELHTSSDLRAKKGGRSAWQKEWEARHMKCLRMQEQLDEYAMNGRLGMFEGQDLDSSVVGRGSRRAGGGTSAAEIGKSEVAAAFLGF